MLKNKSWPWDLAESLKVRPHRHYFSFVFLSAGAVYATLSRINISGLATFDENVAGDDGGEEDLCNFIFSSVLLNVISRLECVRL